jgi:membrane protein YqaA with SNARE-associated domain
VSNRRSRRKRIRARQRREKMKGFSREFAKGGEWSILFLGLIGSLSGVVVTFLAGRTEYAVVLLLVALFVGAALWKREAA